MEEGSKVMVSSEAHHLKTSRVVAAAVSTVFPGIGRILLGKTRAGVAFFCAYGVVASLYWPLRLPRSYFGMFAVIFASMGLFIAAGRHALGTPSQKAGTGCRWWLLLLVPLAHNASLEQYSLAAVSWISRI
jgi:hypothetical protein